MPFRLNVDTFIDLWYERGWTWSSCYPFWSWSWSECRLLLLNWPQYVLWLNLFYLMITKLCQWSFLSMVITLALARLEKYLFWFTFFTEIWFDPCTSKLLIKLYIKFIICIITSILFYYICCSFLILLTSDFVLSGHRFVPFIAAVLLNVKV